MEKIIKSAAIILIIFLYIACVERTPEEILKQKFNISLKGVDYKVETFEEQWCPNGDGYTYIEFKFNTLTENNIKYFHSLGLKKMPILKKQEIPNRCLIENGYYLFEREDQDDVRDYKLFVIDIKTNRAILYFQYL